MTGGGVTAAGPVAERLGTRRPAAGARREYLLTLLAGVVGAAVVAHAAVTAIQRAADRNRTQADRSNTVEH